MNRFSVYPLTFFACVTLAWLSCRNGTEKNAPTQAQVSREDLIRHQQNVTKDEREDIEAYIDRHNLDMKSTQTGLRYQIIPKGEAGSFASNGDNAQISYRVELLDGTVVYSSDSTGNFNFIVGKSELAAGLQEGIRFMRAGDEGIFIVPSHLAYGLTGDGDKIRQYDVLVIQMKLLRLASPGR